MTVDELEVLITANTKNFENAISGVNKKVSGLVNQSAKTSKSLAVGFAAGTVATKILSAAVSAVTANLSSAVERLDTLNNYTNVMSNLGVNAEDAEASVQRLSDGLLGLPTTLNDAASSVQRLTAANGNVKASTEMFLALNNAILAGGADMQTQKSALEQLSQSYSKGKPDMMEWRAAMTAMPAQLKQTAIAMGYVNADELGTALRNGKVSMNEFMMKLVELNKNGANGFQSFEEQAKNSTGGVSTSMTNVKTAITRGLTEVMNAIGQSNIAGFFQGIAKAINRATVYVTGFVKACVWAVSAVSSLFGGKTKSKTQSTAKNISSIGSAAASTASDIDGTTKSAKKLSKALNGLASFEEMNVLSENSGSSGGSDSGSSSAGGAGSLGDMDFSDWNFEEKGSEAETVAERIKRAFTGVGNVIKTVWDSSPVQAFIGFVGTVIEQVKLFGEVFGGTFVSNISSTWTSIEGNVSSAITNLSTYWTNFWTDLDKGVQKWGQPIIEKVTGVFDSIWKDAIQPAVEFASELWNGFTAELVRDWNENRKPLVDNIGEFVDTTIALFQKVWDDVLEPIVTPFLETLSWLWEEHISKLVSTVNDFIGSLINGALEIYNKFIAPLISYLIDKLAPAWSLISNVIVGVLGTIIAGVSDTFNGIITVFKGLINFVTGVFTGNWKKAWEGIKSIVSGAMSGLSSIVKVPINAIIDVINGFIAGINKVKIPDWVPGTGGKGINIPKIPKLAYGGVVNKPTVSMFGEAGAEVVMPLERNTGWMDKLGDRIASRINSVSSSGAGINLTVKLGEDNIFDKFLEYVNQKGFESNGEVVYA